MIVEHDDNGAATHHFEKNKKVKNTKCIVCNSNIDRSSAYACTLCDAGVHKQCTDKARKDVCHGGKILDSDSHPKLGRSYSKGSVQDQISHSDSGGQLGVNNGNNLEILFSDGSRSTISYQKDTILINVLQGIREEKELDGAYVIYDKAGKIINNYDQSLKKLKSNFPLFYTEKSKKKPLRKSPKLYVKSRYPPSPDSKSSGISPVPGTYKSRPKSFLGPRKNIPKKTNSSKDMSELVEQRHGTMSITVLTVNDIANQTSAYKLLYFSLTNLDTNQRHRSKLLENTANPTWNQTIKFHMPFAYGQWNIKFWAIRKIDANAADVLLGETDFELKNFKDGDSETKTYIIKQDNHKKKGSSRKVQFEFLQVENHRLYVELESEKRQREIVRLQLEELQKQYSQQQNAHSAEMNSILSKFSTKTNNNSVDPAVLLLKEEKEQLIKELQETKKELQVIKAKDEELRKHYEEQIEFYRVQAEGGKKFPKVTIQWSYQDRKLKANQASVEEEDQSRNWIPSKGKGADVVRKSIIVKQPNSDEPDSRTTTLTTVPDANGLTTKKKRIQDVYEFGEVLGTGGSSVVREGINKETGQRVAIKILDNYDNVEDASDEEEAFWAEIEIIKQLDHPCILNVYDFYEDSEHYYVVLELLAGNELFDQIIEKGYYKEPEAVAIIYQVLLALEHLEQKHICHLDLKPENILFTDDTHTRIKLIDFGEASSCKEHKLTGWVGTNNYMAPEMIKHSEYDCKVDMWSMGVVSYIMLCGSFAFDADDEIELYQDIMEMKYEFRSPDWDHVSEDAKHFVTSLLTGPNERLSASQALQHKWIKTNLPLSTFDPRCLWES